jgi:RNase H-fold protein (predicted Holliday junction resolvase)
VYDREALIALIKKHAVGGLVIGLPLNMNGTEGPSAQSARAFARNFDLKHPLRFAKEMKPRKHMMEDMGAAYTANGLITLAGSRMYTSMADTDEVIDDALERFERVLSSVEGV